MGEAIRRHCGGDVLTQAIYSVEKHKRSDAWLHSPALNRHIRQAYAKRLSDFNLLESPLILSTTSFDHDAHYCIDCEFTAIDDEEKEIRLTGRAAFRCRTPGYLKFGDVTISKGFADKRPAEFYKTRATTMIYAHESYSEKPGKRPCPDNGFPLVLIFNLSHTINLIEMERLPCKTAWKEAHEQFYAVKILDLYEHNLLWYVGICPTQRAKTKISDYIRTIFAKKMPEIYKALQGSKSCWSAVSKPKS